MWHGVYNKISKYSSNNNRNNRIEQNRKLIPKFKQNIGLVIIQYYAKHNKT